MTTLARIYDVAEGQCGYLTSSDAQRLDPPVTATALGKLAHAGHLRRVSHGVYRLVRFPESDLDAYVEAVLWPVGTEGVVLGESALELHDIGAWNPSRIQIGVPIGWRTHRVPPPAIQLTRIDPTELPTALFECVRTETVQSAFERIVRTSYRLDLLSDALAQAVDRRQLSARESASLLGRAGRAGRQQSRSDEGKRASPDRRRIRTCGGDDATSSAALGLVHAGCCSDRARRRAG